LAQVLKVKCTEQSARIQETIEQLKKSISFGMLKWFKTFRTNLIFWNTLYTFYSNKGSSLYCKNVWNVLRGDIHLHSDLAMWRKRVISIDSRR
jgi:hypothetical protein